MLFKKPVERCKLAYFFAGRSGKVMFSTYSPCIDIPCWICTCKHYTCVAAIKFWLIKSSVKPYVTLGNFSCNLSRNFVATQVTRKIAQSNIPFHRHSMQHCCCRHRCEEWKSVLLWATPLATPQQLFQLLLTVTSSQRLVSQRLFASPNKTTPFCAQDKLQETLPSVTRLKQLVSHLTISFAAKLLDKLHEKLRV